MQDLLDVHDVARILKLKVSTVYKYTMTGKLPTVRINGNLRFREDDLQAFVEERSVAPISVRA